MLKTIRNSLVALFWAATTLVAASAASPVGVVCGPAVPNSAGGASSPVNMAGANFFAIPISEYNAPVTVTNSQGDTFKQVALPTPDTDLVFAYAYNVTGVAGETFSVTGFGSQPNFCVYGFANMPTADPFQSVVGNGPSFTASLGVTITPGSANGNLVFSAMSWQATVVPQVYITSVGLLPPTFYNPTPAVQQGLASSYGIQYGEAPITTLWMVPSPVGIYEGSISFNGPALVVVPPPPPPPSQTAGVREFGPCQSPSDLYYNAPVSGLPVAPASNAHITSLGAGRLSPNPEFLLNYADATTPTVDSSTMTWDETDGETDGGNYPLTQNTLVSNYIFPAGGAYQAPTVAASPAGGWGGDAHVLMLNTATCNLYEIFALQSNAPPYHAGAASIINVGDYNLRSQYKLVPPVTDPDGLDNGTASGIPIWPLVLTHAEVFANQPITHAVRMTFNQTQGSPGYEWPATHAAGGTGTSGIYMGATFRLKASFDSTTCHNGMPGAVYPPWFKQVITALQTYGIYNSDYGYPGLISTDAVADWGDPSSTTSDNWTFAGFLHCIQFTDLEQVDNTPRVTSVSSGKVNLTPAAR